ncbi:MAG: isoleucine--tRNA ligase [Phycisphaerales bacterium]|nr:isoleucine--tRNA ligase [Phycisphaerales bacterium]
MSDSAAATRNYKQTLNLPKTPFPMRANLAQNEPQSLDRWTKSALYDRIGEARAEAPPFIFHDGPPYANGSIHVGHLLNKVLKDMVVRSQILMGRACPYVPGWDCHGLPIEHRVMTGLVESGKIAKLQTLAEDVRRTAIRRECKAYAEKFIKLQSGQMQRLLTLADYGDPYLTMAPRYEKSVLEVFATLVREGVVYRDLKPVHWSIDNQTALAEAELEYHDKEDLSVYVDFEATDRDAVARAFGVELDLTPSFMIWTTTPWTLPANLAIAVNENVTYALVAVDGSVTILARELVERVTTLAKAESVEILGEAPGRALVGLTYRHPFCPRTSPVVAAEYVTIEDGTGLVHTAPGQGTDDYHTGMREGLETYCPVRGDGTYDDSVPEWIRGQSIWDANAVITEHLRASGHLVHDHRFMHSYPHDWRSRGPVIFRCTEQWFISVARPTATHGRSLRDMALDVTATDVTFVPDWGRNRMRGMLESRPDWCISRQRAWGLPIPAFRRPDGSTFLTAASVAAVSDAFGARGSDAWFTETPAALLATYDASSDPDAPADLDVASLEKMQDIFDVWFESGSSWHAVMRARGLGYPIDLYLEGSDQHRGWFQLSLLPGLGVTGRAPFRTLLTHGFTVDKDGRKMSKSLGNALDVDEVLKQYGADVARWWVSSLAFENDMKVDMSFLDLAADSYRKVRNTLRFLLSNLDDFVPCTAASPAGMCVDVASIPGTSIDAYILGETRRLQDRVLEAYRAYEFRRAHQAIYDFCNDTLSAFYCVATKDRLYCDRTDSPRRRRTQTVMWDVLEVLTRLLAPIIPHTADEAYRALWKDDAARCVHLCAAATLPEVEVDPAWTRVLEVREAALKAMEGAKGRGIENPLDAEVVLPDGDGTLRRFAADFADLLGVSRVGFSDGGVIVVNDLREEPRCERSWRRDGTVRERSDGGMLSDRDAEAVGLA